MITLVPASGIASAPGGSRVAPLALHCARARGGATGVRSQKTAFVDGCAAGVGIIVAESQLAFANFGERTGRAAVGSAILDYTGKGLAQVIAANGQVVRPKERIAAAFQ